MISSVRSLLDELKNTPGITSDKKSEPVSLSIGFTSAPSVAAAEIKSEQTHRYVVEIPAVLTSEQWLEKYGKCDKESDLPDKPDRPLH
jgi:hypothetical protein